MLISLLCCVTLLIQTITIKSEHCVTPQNENGNCVSLYACPKLINLLGKQEKSGEDYVRRSRCGSTSTDPLVCCPEDPARQCTTPNKKTGKCTSLGACPELLKMLKTQQAHQVDYVRKSGCGITDTDAFVCCPSEAPSKKNEGSAQTNNNILIPSQAYCGYQHSDDYGSRVDGTDITEFPWLAGLYYKLSNGNYEVRCQGSVINVRYVLTAAHCVANLPSSWKLQEIHLGEYNIKNSTDCIENSGLTECSDPVQAYAVEDIIVHPQFKNIAVAGFDIALIRLNQTIDAYSDYIRPICLPVPGATSFRPGDLAIASGWGASFTESKTPVKKKVFYKLMSNEECNRAYKSLPALAVGVSDTHLCTEFLRNNSNVICTGDSGGPVMFSNKSQWYIEGIASFGPKQCGSYPDVNTRVSKFIDWISISMKPW